MCVCGVCAVSEKGKGAKYAAQYLELGPERAQRETATERERAWVCSSVSVPMDGGWGGRRSSPFDGMACGHFPLQPPRPILPFSPPIALERPFGEMCCPSAFSVGEGGLHLLSQSLTSAQWNGWGGVTCLLGRPLRELNGGVPPHPHRGDRAPFPPIMGQFRDQNSRDTPRSALTGERPLSAVRLEKIPPPMPFE